MSMQDKKKVQIQFIKMKYTESDEKYTGWD